MAISYPDKGQPLDIEYLHTMATEINNVSSIVQATKTQSHIMYDKATGVQGVKDVATTNTVFYAATTQTTIGPNIDPTVTFNFNYFKVAPVITTSINTGGPATIGFIPYITSITTTTCTVKVFATSAVSVNQNLQISIIAIGEPATGT